MVWISIGVRLKPFSSYVMGYLWNGMCNCCYVRFGWPHMHWYFFPMLFFPVYVPILHGTHYYIISVNAKKCLVNIIDNSSASDSIENLYLDTPKQLVTSDVQISIIFTLLCIFIYLYGFHVLDRFILHVLRRCWVFVIFSRGNGVGSTLASYVLVWQPNQVDCGVFAMRHV